MGVLYVDTSALVKLVRTEAESGALVSFLAERRWVIGDLHRAELRRAVRRAGPQTSARADRLLAELDTIVLDGSMLDAAGRLDPAALRTLDAIHLACARTLDVDLAGVVTYDERLGDAARHHGIRTFTPC
ncbi:MAG: type II toxin-antitoxin system VapC family toxin [Egibacteraceae bacterium]